MIDFRKTRYIFDENLNNDKMKKYNYYLTLSSKHWDKFLATGNEKFLDNSIRFQELAEKSI